jgi:hypothetical protein
MNYHPERSGGPALSKVEGDLLSSRARLNFCRFFGAVFGKPLLVSMQE